MPTTEKKEDIFPAKKCKDALKESEGKLQSAPILGYPNQVDDYRLTTDASLIDLCAIQTKKQDGVDRGLTYGCKTLTKSQKKNSATKREPFAVVHSTKCFKTYLLG